MKISTQFPILQKQNALLLVVRNKAANIYRLVNGKVEEQGTVPIKNDKEQTLRRYLYEEMKKLRRPFDSIYLFAPDQFIEKAANALPRQAAAKLRRKFSGNFAGRSLSSLLTEIKSTRDRLAKLTAASRVRKHTQVSVAPGTSSLIHNKIF